MSKYTKELKLAVVQDYEPSLDLVQNIWDLSHYSHAKTAWVLSVEYMG